MLKISDIIALIQSYTRKLKTEINNRLISDELKAALMALAENAAYSTNQGQTVYNALADALYTEWTVAKTLTHCTSSNNAQSVTKNAAYSATITPDEGYSLSGATVSITMGGVDITSTAYAAGVITIASVTGNLAISVEATNSPQSYVTSGLVAYWDGIDNTGSGHDGTVTTWSDLVGNYDLTQSTVGGTWDTNALTFNETAFNGYYRDSLWEFSENATIEVVLAPGANSKTMSVATFDRSDTTISAGNYDARRFTIYSDNTYGFAGKSANTYLNVSGKNATDVRKMACVYNGFTISKAFINNVQLELSNKTHSLTYGGNEQMRVGASQFIGTSYPFNGKIYAIRVYNRALTDDEIAQNFAYDNNRFNLGVS